jgi:hypothetical protein
MNDFVLFSKVPNETIERYKDIVPQEIITMWKDYGFGAFIQGFLKSVNPDDFKDLLLESCQRYHDSVVLFATSMGDLLIWSDGYVRLLDFRHGVVRTILFTFEYFFQNLSDSLFLEGDKYLSWRPYPEAIEKYGEPGYNECFGFFPLLGLGGPEEIGHFQKVKLFEHIMIINALMGPLDFQR